MSRTSSIRRVAGVVFAIALLSGAARLVRACGDHVDGIVVRVHNVDTHALHAVSVIVRGHTYDLGDLPPGMTRAATVAPTSDSSVEIMLTDSSGQRRVLPAFGYIEPGNSGRILVDVSETQLRGVEDHVGI